MNKEDYELRETVRKRLIECRKGKGLSQLELSRDIETPVTTVASWEQGRSLPSIQMLYQLSRYYGKTIGYMYGEEN